jgi:hypothetical protein
MIVKLLLYTLLIPHCVKLSDRCCRTKRAGVSHTSEYW